MFGVKGFFSCFYEDFTIDLLPPFPKIGGLGDGIIGHLSQYAKQKSSAKVVTQPLIFLFNYGVNGQTQRTRSSKLPSTGKPYQPLLVTVKQDKLHKLNQLKNYGVSVIQYISHVIKHDQYLMSIHQNEPISCCIE